MALKRDLTALMNSKATDQSANSYYLIRIFSFTHIQFRNPREMGTKETNSVAQPKIIRLSIVE